jgi:hypothetical protein
MRRSLIIWIALATVLPAVAGGQVTVRTVPELVLGDTLRVWATGRADHAIGRLTRLDGRELAIIGGVETVVPFNAIQRLEVKRGEARSASRTLGGAVIGAVSGAIVGGLLVKAACGNCDDGNQGPPLELLGYLVAIPVGGLVGGFTGGMIGGAKRPQWILVSFR